MARSRFKTRSTRKLAFKNREGVLEDLRCQLSASRSSKEYFRVISIIGVGGCGKTRLLDKLSSEARDYGFKVIRISLECEESGMEAAPLKAIRDQLKFECMLFDIALARYFVASGQMHSLSTNVSLSSNMALKTAETAAGVSGLISLPLGFAVEAFDRIKKKTVKSMKYTRDEFEDIDRIMSESEELLERLPFYLGSDIERRLNSSPDHFVFFYDSYEKQRSATLGDRAPWLREFIGSLDRDLHIIASREQLEWPAGDWGDVCTPAYVIDTLPEKDVKALFVEECNPPKCLLPKLVELSRCVPFYIEMLITEYLSLNSELDIINIADLPSNVKQSFERFINHLDKPIQKLVLALATVQFFDRFLLHGLIRSLNLSVDLIEVDDILSAFFIEPVNGQAGVYKTHDLLSDFVRRSTAHNNERRLVLLEASKIVSIASISGRPSDSILLMFTGLCEGSSFDTLDSPNLVEHLIDIGYSLYDKGYWRELAKFDGMKLEDSKPTDADIVRGFFNSISIRRIESNGAGLSAIRVLGNIRNRFGGHGTSLEIETAYLIELSGDYGLARSEIERIYNSCMPLNPAVRSHYRALLYYADFLIMDGQLERGSDLLLSAYEKLDPTQRTNWAELVRHRSHAFRFSALFEEAEGLYLRAMDAAKESPAMLAKLITNLAETRCWTDPEVAISNADTSINQNTILGNKIELAKAHTAKAIALTQISELKSASSEAMLAEITARDACYPSGILFAKQAECLIEVAKGREELALARHFEVEELIHQIGTYEHIGYLTAHAIQLEETGIAPSIHNWIQPETIYERYAAILSRLQSSNV